MAEDSSVPSWKAFERDVAKVLGGQRRPVTGLDRGDGDVFTDQLEVQVKKRAAHPSTNLLREWLDGIRRTAQRRNRIGVVVWKPTGSRTNEALVVMRLDDFTELAKSHEVVSHADRHMTAISIAAEDE